MCALLTRANTLPVPAATLLTLLMMGGHCWVWRTAEHECMSTCAGHTCTRRHTEHKAMHIYIKFNPSSCTRVWSPPSPCLPLLTGDDVVLLVGKRYPLLKDIARSYGFSKALTADEYHAAHPLLYPGNRCACLLLMPCACLCLCVCLCV